MAKKEEHKHELLENPEAIKDRLIGAENWIESNPKIVVGIAVVILLAVGGYFGFHYYKGTRNVEAQKDDVVVCPAVADEQAASHAGTLDDELALLVVHGVLHVLGHDHADDTDAAAMRAAELAHLEAYHWGGPAPTAFRQEHVS